MKRLLILALTAAMLCACSRNKLPDGLEMPETHAEAVNPADVEKITLTRYDENNEVSATKTLEADNPFFNLLITIYDTTETTTLIGERRRDIRITLAKTDGSELHLDLYTDNSMESSDGTTFAGKNMREFIYSFAADFAPTPETTGTEA